MKRFFLFLIVFAFVKTVVAQCTFYKRTTCQYESETFETVDDLLNKYPNHNVDYKWKFGDGSPDTNTQNINNVKHSYEKIGTFILQVNYKIHIDKQKKDSGCVQYEITVISKPHAEFKIEKACQGDGIIFKDLSHSTIARDSTDGTTYEINPITEWKWYFDKKTESNLEYKVKRDFVDFKEFNKIREHTVTLIVYTSAKGKTCQDDSTISVTVNSNPKATLLVKSMSSNANDTSEICKDEPITFSFKDQVDITKWKWNFGDDSFDSTTTTINHSYSSTGTFKAKLLLINETTNCTTTKTKIIKVFGIPTPFIELQKCRLFNDGIYFIGRNTNVSYNVDIVEYEWNFGDGTKKNNKNSYNVDHAGHAYRSRGNYNVNLKIISRQGCGDNNDTTFLYTHKHKPCNLILVIYSGKKMTTKKKKVLKELIFRLMEEAYGDLKIKVVVTLPDEWNSTRFGFVGQKDTILKNISNDDVLSIIDTLKDEDKYLRLEIHDTIPDKIAKTDPTVIEKHRNMCKNNDAYTYVYHFYPKVRRRTVKDSIVIGSTASAPEMAGKTEIVRLPVNPFDFQKTIKFVDEKYRNWIEESHHNRVLFFVPDTNDVMTMFPLLPHSDSIRTGIVVCEPDATKSIDPKTNIPYYPKTKNLDTLLTNQCIGGVYTIKESGKILLRELGLPPSYACKIFVGLSLSLPLNISKFTMSKDESRYESATLPIERIKFESNKEYKIEIDFNIWFQRLFVLPKILNRLSLGTRLNYLNFSTKMKIEDYHDVIKETQSNRRNEDWVDDQSYAELIFGKNFREDFSLQTLSTIVYVKFYPFHRSFGLWLRKNFNVKPYAIAGMQFEVWNKINTSANEVLTFQGAYKDYGENYKPFHHLSDYGFVENVKLSTKPSIKVNNQHKMTSPHFAFGMDIDTRIPCTNQKIRVFGEIFYFTQQEIRFLTNSPQYIPDKFPKKNFYISDAKRFLFEKEKMLSLTEILYINKFSCWIFKVGISFELGVFFAKKQATNLSN